MSENDFRCILGRRFGKKRYIQVLYTLYCCHKLVFFCREVNMNHFLSKLFIRAQYLIIFDSKQDLEFFELFLNY